MSEKHGLEQEWMVLHHHYEQYEVIGFVLKAITTVLFFVALLTSPNIFIILAFILIMWALEAIWKTFQGRTEQRILNIESYIKNNKTDSAFQFYSEWEKNRPSFLGLILIYCRQGLRPTVAFPYVVLVLILVAISLGNSF